VGGGAWYADNEARLLWRDCKTTGSHAFTDCDVAGQSYGRHLMGLPPDEAAM
jgi:hypothetical protein